MGSLKLLKKYVVDSQFFVSMMGTLFAIFFMIEQNAFRWPTVFLVFITYFSGYLYTKYQQNRKLFSKILILNIISFMVCAVLIFLNHNEIRLLKWLAIVTLGLLYNSAFLDQIIRKIPLLKVFYVGLVWGLINSWLILPSFHLEIFLISFLFTTALVLPFDIRDMNADDIVTFPRIIGVTKTKLLAMILILISVAVAFIAINSDFFNAFGLSACISILLIVFSKPTFRDSYFSFWVELCSGLPFLFFILLKYF